VWNQPYSRMTLSIWIVSSSTSGSTGTSQFQAWCCLGYLLACGHDRAWVLSPVCALIFVAGMILETVYCRMLEVTYFVYCERAGKALGAIAAVTPWTSRLPYFRGVLFLWLFCWR